MSNKTKQPNTDPALWIRRPAFGVAGGPTEVALTDEGKERAFSVGAQVRLGGPSEALRALASGGGDGYLSVREGCRLWQTFALGRFDQIAWGHLRALGLVESFLNERGDGVRMTELGKRAADAGYEETHRLLERCRRAAEGKS